MTGVLDFGFVVFFFLWIPKDFLHDFSMLNFFFGVV